MPETSLIDTAPQNDTLYNDPNNPDTHATTGWAALESGDSENAMLHFREALRIDPISEQARLGIIEALKPRHALYRLILRCLFWMSRLGQRLRWFLIFGALISVLVLQSLAHTAPQLWTPLLPFFIAYGLFVYLASTADTLFNLLIRFDTLGRLALSEEETRASNYVGLLLIVTVAFGIGFGVTRNPATLFAATGTPLMVIPVAATFRREVGRNRTILMAYTIGLVLAGAVGLGLVAIGFVEFGSSAALATGALLIVGIIIFMSIAAFLK